MEELKKIQVQLELLDELAGDKGEKLYPAPLLRRYKNKMQEIAKLLKNKYDLEPGDLFPSKQVTN